ncbi:hypothetical protein E3J62_09220 [candidate division TA06 bacterium]|uniref:RelA/SpoT domain-containing protein n=1 Tax=candidate division TA06 bacterium TaxID=2250710 RepID=A0A523UQM1_UNCT6|nr:MAG: hypothetical protein E3J62_09220 [candidate division TA06 bacterium]
MKNNEPGLEQYLVAGQTYNTMRPYYERAAAKVADELRNYFRDIKATYIRYINTRVKDWNSAVDKMRQKGYSSLEEVEDMAGVRIVCHNEVHAQEVITFLTVHPDFRNVASEDIDREDGYRATHAELETTVTVMGQALSVKVEVQIRTLAQDTWATLSHRDAYKTDVHLPDSWLEKMRKLGDQLEEVDKVAQKLCDERVDVAIGGQGSQEQISVQAVARMLEDLYGRPIPPGEAQDCLVVAINQGLDTVSKLKKFLQDKEVRKALGDLSRSLMGMPLSPYMHIYLGGGFGWLGIKDGIAIAEEQIKALPVFPRIQELLEKARSQTEQRGD